MILTPEQCQDLDKQRIFGGYDIDTIEVQYSHLVKETGSWFQRLNYWCPFRWWNCSPSMKPLCGSSNLWGWHDLPLYSHSRFPLASGFPKPYDLTCEGCIAMMKERLR